jgi:hypothetical protein
MRATGVVSSAKLDFDGSLDELKALDDSSIFDVLDYRLLHTAIYRNDVEMTRWLLEKNCYTTKYAHEYASKNGNLEIIKLLIKHRQMYDYYAVAYSVDHMECFKFYFNHYIHQYTSGQHTWHANAFWYNSWPCLKLEEIDLDDPVWRQLCTLQMNFKKYPGLQAKVEDKKVQLAELQCLTRKLLRDYLPLDIIEYCINPFF